MYLTNDHSLINAFHRLFNYRVRFKWYTMYMKWINLFYNLICHKENDFMYIHNKPLTVKCLCLSVSIRTYAKCFHQRHSSERSCSSCNLFKWLYYPYAADCFAYSRNIVMLCTVCGPEIMKIVIAVVYPHYILLKLVYHSLLLNVGNDNSSSFMCSHKMWGYY